MDAQAHAGAARLPGGPAAQPGDARRRAPPRRRGYRGDRSLSGLAQDRLKPRRDTMITLTRRQLHRLDGRIARWRDCMQPRAAFAQAKPKLVVIGGGPGWRHGGALRGEEAAGAIDVTLIEPQKHFHHLLLLESLCRRVSQLQFDHPRLRQGGAPGRSRRQRLGALDRSRPQAGRRSRAAPAFRTTGWWWRPAST